MWPCAWGSFLGWTWHFCWWGCRGYQFGRISRFQVRSRPIIFQAGQSYWCIDRVLILCRCHFNQWRYRWGWVRNGVFLFWRSRTWRVRNCRVLTIFLPEWIAWLFVPCCWFLLRGYVFPIWSTWQVCIVWSRCCWEWPFHSQRNSRSTDEWQRIRLWLI